MKMKDENREAINGIFQKLSETPATMDYYAEIKSTLVGENARYNYGDIEDGENRFHWEVRVWCTEDEPEDAVHLTFVESRKVVADGHITWQIEGS